MFYFKFFYTSSKCYFTYILLYINCWEKNEEKEVEEEELFISWIIKMLDYNKHT